MSSFDIAIPFILKHEGGFVNDLNDHGGATDFGISIRYLISTGGLKTRPEMDLNHDGLLDWKDIQAMTKEEACAVYRAGWWDANHYGNIQDQAVATKALDMAVNMGSIQAHKLLQRSLSICGKPVIVDGVLGDKSFLAINTIIPANLLHVICQIQSTFYRMLAARDPSQAKFLKGWLFRAAFQGV